MGSSSPTLSVLFFPLFFSRLPFVLLLTVVHPLSLFPFPLHPTSFIPPSQYPPEYLPSGVLSLPSFYPLYSHSILLLLSLSLSLSLSPFLCLHVSYRPSPISPFFTNKRLQHQQGILFQPKPPLSSSASSFSLLSLCASSLPIPSHPSLRIYPHRTSSHIDLIQSFKTSTNPHSVPVQAQSDQSRHNSTTEQQRRQTTETQTTKALNPLVLALFRLPIRLSFSSSTLFPLPPLPSSLFHFFYPLPPHPLRTSPPLVLYTFHFPPFSFARSHSPSPSHSHSVLHPSPLPGKPTTATHYPTTTSNLRRQLKSTVTAIMRYPLKNWTLGSTVLLSLALLSHLAALGEASLTHQGVASTIDDLKSSSLFWKRDRLPRHSSSTSSNQQVQTGGSGSLLRKRSLFSHVNDDIVVPPSPPVGLPAVHQRGTHLIEDEEEEEEFGNVVRVTVKVTHERSREREVVVEAYSNNKHNSNNIVKDDKVSETTDKLSFWADDEEDEEERAFIEPHYPSIDLFDEEELLEVGEDGILREKGHNQSSRSFDGDEEDRHEQGGWLVDEWEEELEGEMDEWVDWVEEDHVLGQIDAEKDKNRLRDQSAMDSLVLDEDEASPFQRLFSESWLF